MLFREVRASRMIALLAQIGIKTAKDMSIEDACRSYSRMDRGMNARGPGMSPAQLADYSRKKRRGRVTHRGKR